MTNLNALAEALEDAIRALRDIAALDETRPLANRAEKTALRSLERINQVVLQQTGTDLMLDAPGHTPRPDETIFAREEVSA